ncbi:NAD(P)-binding protein [Aulographum hederae CBS 113979]|uniref:NAD(P)-binding protein n=1 Tax=Aulographum hederae CBS 113979 TaxID=1176131 RepID=A0A6G1GY75_9PEZI|nr:NAD(P)-binding protein [Aulographum hederae CBS 113979]
MSSSSTPKDDSRITIVGAGTIGLSFVALHLQFTPPENITICDTRPDLAQYVATTLPLYQSPPRHSIVSAINLTSDLPSAVKNATIVQEQGPENLAFKSKIWETIEAHAPKDALLWSSTSGIVASAQNVNMKDKTRLLVVHPYNPPHIMPLLELVPSPQTSQAVIDQTLKFWRDRGREPVVIKKECTGFVANRLAFALLRESIHLVNEGVVTAEELDTVVETSMGPRWAVAGPFKSYHAGGGARGLRGFFENIGGTVQGCWDDGGKVNVGEGWEDALFEQAEEAYGWVDTGKRDRATKRVLEAVREES